MSSLRTQGYAVTPVVRDGVRRPSLIREHRWLWVPAFAGTTQGAVGDRRYGFTIPPHPSVNGGLYLANAPCESQSRYPPILISPSASGCM
jgi:hypothetical protein